MQFTASFSILASLVAFVAAETHTITFTNNCGRGTPTLVSQDGAILSTGGAFTADGPIIGAIAYLQTGGCGLNGDSCTAVETTLQNPTSPGAGSATDITLIPDHAFSVTSGFGYFDGCDGTGLDCTSASCPGAFTDPTNGDIVSCEADNVNLAITFCD
ncbi:glycopeptide [Gymnopus androsaceus JB14]|uniref:Glycopeptide n=1 Tax=Gymnopus androsaceus JB14 TaxID=1447944 RepID=A0A6A4HC49_9AGAR|nr:glycopeptide [Gymnopus androsaceus JB14]KAE9394829.1 glycopeptide [Gymnopus androsaceus JB14]KAE9394830.1 glycopeptide [Gymnopus androsaceus JB14]